MWADFIGNGKSFTWVTSGYSKPLVNGFNALVPHGSKKWDPRQTQWEVAAEYWQPLIELCTRHGCRIHTEGAVNQQAAGAQQYTLDMDYMGLIYHRSGDTWTANGFHDGDWNISFPLKVLQSWFNVTFTPGQMPTLYGVLGVDSNLAGLAFDKALKKAHRVAARTWHPDVNKEAIAPEVFKTIQDAYEKLGDPMFRKRYDAGLLFEKDTEYGSAVLSSKSIAWYPPKRCGKLKVKATRNVGSVYRVSEIMVWEDIMNTYGQMMVSHWPKGSDNFEIAWRTA